MTIIVTDRSGWTCGIQGQSDRTAAVKDLGMPLDDLGLLEAVHGSFRC